MNLQVTNDDLEIKLQDQHVKEARNRNSQNEAELIILQPYLTAAPASSDQPESPNNIKVSCIYSKKLWCCVCWFNHGPSLPAREWMSAHPAPEYVGISVSAPLLIAPAELNIAMTMATTHIYSIQYIGQLVVATPMPSGGWSKNLGCWIVDHIDVVLLNPWFKWLADHLLSCNIQRQLSSLLEHTSPWCRDILGVASNWHVAWACMGLIWRYWRWRQRCASLRCTHAVHSETIPWQHLHTPTKKPRNW